MEKAKVYFTDFRTSNGIGLPEKLKRLCRKAGLQTMDLENKFVAIKMHFGELGNVSFLRPNYAKAVADVIKELGGKPFLTDCNTLYVGSRKNADSQALIELVDKVFKEENISVLALTGSSSPEEPISVSDEESEEEISESESELSLSSSSELPLSSRSVSMSKSSF